MHPYPFQYAPGPTRTTATTTATATTKAILVMIAAAIIQTALLLSSGAFNVLLNPGSLSVEKQLFVSSVILMIGFGQGFVLLLCKLLFRSITGWNIRFGSNYLFAPLARAMSNAINDRPGETDVDIITPIVSKKPPRAHGPASTGPGPLNPAAYDVFDSDDDVDDEDATATHFMPELDIAIDERRNVYTDIYFLGIATFTVTYCIDTVSPAPATAFISGLLIMSIAQSVNIAVILARTERTLDADENVRSMRAKRLLTLTSCVFATGAFAMFCVGLANSQLDVSSVNSIFDVTFSVLLPLIAPWLLVTVSPKHTPLRTLFECTPFVFSICFSFVTFFLATRGQISTIVHELSTVSNRYQNVTEMSVSNSVVDLEFHSDVNASLHFNMDFFSTTSVDSAGNIPMLLCAPLIKIPTIVVVLANVMNRSNLVVITALLVTMSMREMQDKTLGLNTHRTFCVSFALSVLSLVFNVVKYVKFPGWLTRPPARIAKTGAEQPMSSAETRRAGVQGEDPDLDLEDYMDEHVSEHAGR